MQPTTEMKLNALAEITSARYVLEELIKNLSPFRNNRIEKALIHVERAETQLNRELDRRVLVP